MNIRSVVFIAMLVGSSASWAGTAGKSPYNTIITNDIQGVGPNASIKPYICLQDKNGNVTYQLAPGKSVEATRYSGNIYYAGATIRFGGCLQEDTYLGYVGIHFGMVPSLTYNSPDKVHIEYANPAITDSGHLEGFIKYTAIQPNFNLLSAAPSQYSDLNFVGANLSGLEFGKVIDPVVVPNLSQEDVSAKDSDLAEVQSFLKAGMNTIRVPISWGFLQLAGPGKGELNADYFNSYVKPLLETLTSARVNTIVDLHAYMRYSQFGKEYSGCGKEGKCPDGTLVLDPKAYEDVWLKLYALMKADPKIDMNYILLDLVNEPVNVPDDLVFTIQANAIKKLREQGYQGYILVEGNAWSGLHSWRTATWQSSDGGATYSNESLFSRDNFLKAGITDLSKIIINVHQYLDSDFSGTHDQCMMDLTTTGVNGFNLDAFIDYLNRNHLKAIVTEFGAGKDSQTCTQAMNTFLTYLKANSAKDRDSGFVGWTIWSVGHGWGDYNLRVTPASYQMGVLSRHLQPITK